MDGGVRGGWNLLTVLWSDDGCFIVGVFECGGLLNSSCGWLEF